MPESHTRSRLYHLNKDDLRVYEEGALQQIRNISHEDIPVAASLPISFCAR